ncbi:ATP-binding protein [Povalibacter sp.]|uniref:ATP-binding protein n=1 Tax=Povalibacter sp. TaxID=1962978 RepID=UPI002F3EA752
MRFFRRSLIALGVAATLPTLIFAAIGGFYFLRAERLQVETATLRRSDTIVTLSDATLQGNLNALHVLSTSVYFETNHWSEFYPRVRRVWEGNPQWVAVYLFDASSEEQLFDTRRAFGPPIQTRLPGTVTIETLRAAMQPVIGGVVTVGEPVVHLYQPVLREGQLRYVIVAALRTQIFQDILLAQVPRDTIAALVDRHGNFVARTRDYQQRVGTPATRFVRDALKHGDGKFYRGRTYEGFENYTAFHASDWSGLSAHIAVASSLIDTPRSWSFAVVGIAGLGCLALGGLLASLVLREMAEHRRTEEGLRQSQKMEAVGQLTGGIAHDFNNLLTAVIGNLDMIRTRSADNERLRQLADNALEAAQRGAKLTSQLLAFSRSQRMHLESVDLEQLLRGMSALLLQSTGTSIDVQIDVAADARFVTSDPNQLELALLNLAVNARDAMPDGGVLAISTQATRQAQRDFVEIRVADSGVGMSEEVCARSIEPFFTTKQVGQGTGLGLSQVYGVIRESGGSLHIDSAPGQGTTIHMLLPAAESMDVAIAAAPTPSTPVVLEGSAEASVLVADDDRQVRRFIAASLRNLHYHVVDVDSGTAALSQLEQQRFDLLLVDFAMPGMNGAQVAHAARARRPDLRILIVSGYSDSAAIETALGTTPLLRKPFDTAELSAAVAAILSN